MIYIHTKEPRTQFHKGNRYLDINFTKWSCDVGTRAISNVHYDMIAHFEAVASVLASSHPSWHDPVLGNATWITACVTLAIIGNKDTEAKHWAAFQISHKWNGESTHESNIVNFNLHPLSLILVQWEAGCWIRIQNFGNLGDINIHEGCDRWRAVWFQLEERRGVWKNIFIWFYYSTFNSYQGLINKVLNWIIMQAEGGLKPKWADVAHVCFKGINHRWSMVQLQRHRIWRNKPLWTRHGRHQSIWRFDIWQNDKGLRIRHAFTFTYFTYLKHHRQWFVSHVCKSPLKI